MYISKRDDSEESFVHICVTTFGTHNAISSARFSSGENILFREIVKYLTIHKYNLRVLIQRCELIYLIARKEVQVFKRRAVYANV